MSQWLFALGLLHQLEVQLQLPLPVRLLFVRLHLEHVAWHLKHFVGQGRHYAMEELLAAVAATEELELVLVNISFRFLRQPSGLVRVLHLSQLGDVPVAEAVPDHGGRVVGHAERLENDIAWTNAVAAVLRWIESKRTCPI